MTSVTQRLDADRHRGGSTPLRGCSFSLRRWFAILSLASILVTGTAAALLLTRYLTDNMLMRDAEASRDFIESIIKTEEAGGPSTPLGPGSTAGLSDKVIRHIPALPDVLHANLFATDRSLRWSTNRRLVGRTFDDNEDLKRALQGEIVVISGLVIESEIEAAERGSVDISRFQERQRFVEAYLPIRNGTDSGVVAVIEIYKLPPALFSAIDEEVHIVWASAAASGLALYGALFWIVRRADIIMRLQHERLVETETLATIGEMAAAVAHGIRNPLASIRSAAELAREESSDEVDECLRDIISQSDRIDGWVRELLAGSRGASVPMETVDLNRIVREALDGAAAELRRRGIRLSVRAVPLPPMRGSRSPLAHAFGSVLANAIEAMPAGGELRVETRSAGKGWWEIVVEDDGAGMPPQVARRAFSRLFTTKPNGLGLGLALARRILERHGGRIGLDSTEGRGTRVVLTLPAGG